MNGVIADDLFEALRYATAAAERRGIERTQGHYELRRLKDQ